MNATALAPILITGMHRSGTSMVAELLHHCGLFLGPADRMLPPGEGNPNGFWEDKDMDAVTEEALSALSGKWDFLLPGMPEGYARSAKLENARAMGRQAMRLMATGGPWGWKDPRASIMVPFWKHLIPDLRIVIVVRHPLEVGRSLQKRVNGSHHMAMNLWLNYSRHLLEDIDPDERLITHYDSYFIDPDEELARVTEWIGLEPDNNALSAALGGIIASARQQTARAGELLAHEVAGVYRLFCAEAGKTFQGALKAGRLPLIQAGPPPPQLPADPVSRDDAARAKAAFDEGLGHIEEGQTVMAISRLHAATLLNPGYGEAHNDLGVMLMQSGEVESAKFHFALGVELDPGDSAASSNLASAYVELGQVEQAIQVYLAYLQQKPDDIDALFWLAAVADETGSNDLAGQYARRVLELDPAHAEAGEILKRLEEPRNL
ncbi:MAG: tetratricopeptide repeat protein [Candidatus Marinimicrobia bacterium]|nr:tetratricopeptide repeat protein [Candidatus Neomarinimicrobiota bacterium]